MGMSDILAVARTSKAASLDNDKKQHMLDKRFIRNQLKKNAQIKEQEERLNLFKTVADGDKLEDQQSELNAAHKKYQNQFNKYLRPVAETDINLEAILDVDVISYIASSTYIDTEEVEVLFDFIDKEYDLKNKTEAFLNEGLLTVSEESGGAFLDEFIKSNGLGLAEIYVVLNYLFEEVNKREKHKKKLLALLKKLIQKMEQQNSGFLSEFFSLLEHPLVKNEPKIAKGMAKLSDGNVNPSSLNEVVKFVTHYLDNDFTNLVSKCMRLRAHVLTRLNTKLAKHSGNFELDNELALYINFENNLITLNSIYYRLNRFKTNVERSAVWQIAMDNNYAELIKAILAFVDLPLVSEMSFKTLMRGLGVQKTFNNLVGFKNELIRFLGGMPIEIYKGVEAAQKEQRKRIIDGLRKLFGEREGSASGSNSYSQGDDNTQDQKYDYGFLKPRKAPIDYI